MKTLIFALIFPTLVMAAAGDPDEVERISDADISRKLVSVARDVQNEQVLKNAGELNACRSEFQKNSTAPRAKDKLETCIKGIVGTGSVAVTLADKLDLETYNLIPSKSIQNVTNYLTKKLYLELTGVDIDEQNIETRIRAQKFSNKKQVDHKDFFALYKNQIAKNALYEVSRFCFVDLRQTSDTAKASSKTFIEHWNNLDSFTQRIDLNNPNTIDPYTVKDDGSPAFENSSAPATDAGPAYTNIMKNILNGPNTQVQPDRLQNFFFYCGQKIQKLCETFEKQCHDQTTGARIKGCGVNTTTTGTTGVSVGANACLAKTRLTAFRTAMKTSDKIVEEFDKNAGADVSIMLNPNEIVKRYQRGAGPGNEKSLNELTNNASVDFFNASQRENSDDEAQKCVDSNGTDCEKFEIVDDSVARIQTNNEIVYEAKRVAEMERVKELVRVGGQNLDKYIDENYPDLKELVKNKDMPGLEKAISAKWEARKEALQKEIQSRIGSRQIKPDDASKQADDPSKFQNKGQETAVKNAQEALNEKTRLAQVVFFNNIISSSLNLQTQSGQSLGRNVQALNNEIASAENEVSPGLFDNLKTLGSSGGNSGGNNTGTQLTGNESVTNIDFLDEFIGIPKQP